MNYCYVIKNDIGEYLSGGEQWGPRAQAKMFDLNGITELLRLGNPTVECYLNGALAPLSTPLFFGVSGDSKSYCAVIAFAGAEDCIQGLLVALQDTTLAKMSMALPLVAADTMFREIYSFKPPSDMLSTQEYLQKILGRIRALNTAVAPATAEDSVALSVDSVKSLLYEQDQESLYATVREIYKFRGSIDHFVHVPSLLLRELYFLVVHREAVTSVSKLELIKEIANVTGCVSEKIERDPDNVAFSERLKELREACGFDQDMFVQLAELPKDTYAALERGDVTPTVPDMTAVLSVALRNIQSRN